jgi:two-component system CheB/CheR fusion protein
MSIDDLVRSVAPRESAARVRLRGPLVNVPPQQAMALGLVFHELVTNSLKHGALGSSDGLVDLSWARATDTGDGPRVRFTWRESPSSYVATRFRSTTAGALNGENSRSGLALIDGLIRSDLRGRVTFSFPPDGAMHEFEVRLEPAEAPVRAA